MNEVKSDRFTNNLKLSRIDFRITTSKSDIHLKIEFGCNNPKNPPKNEWDSPGKSPIDRWIPSGFLQPKLGLTPRNHLRPRSITG